MCSDVIPIYTRKKESVRLSAEQPVCVCEYEFTHTDAATLGSSAVAATIVEQERAYCRIACRGYQVLPHDREFYEVVFYIDGENTHCTGDYRRPATANTILISAPGEVHGYDYAPGAHSRTKHVYFMPEWIISELLAFWREEGVMPLVLSRLLLRKPIHTDMPHFPVSPEEMGRCERDIDEIREESSRDRPSLFMLKMIPLKLLVRACRAYSTTAEPSAFLPFDNTLLDVLEYIEVAVAQGEALHIRDLARRLDVSPEHLARSLRKATGWSPMGYYQHRRTQHACHLLLDPELTVTEVAHALGFYDTSHFNHLFRKYRGMSPMQYRQRHTAPE